MRTDHREGLVRWARIHRYHGCDNPALAELLAMIWVGNTLRGSVTKLSVAWRDFRRSFWGSRK